MALALVEIDENDNRISIDKAFVDGYNFGDRLLEGVIFQISLTEDKNDIIVKCGDDYLQYFESLNTKKWLKEAKKYVLECPFDSLTSESDNEVELTGIEQDNEKKMTPIKIGLVNNFSDILAGLNRKK